MDRLPAISAPHRAGGVQPSGAISKRENSNAGLTVQPTRVQGPRLLVECDNTQRAGNHIHTVWRDPYRDFGRDPLADHLRTGHGS